MRIKQYIWIAGRVGGKWSLMSTHSPCLRILMRGEEGNRGKHFNIIFSFLWSFYSTWKWKKKWRFLIVLPPFSPCSFIMLGFTIEGLIFSCMKQTTVIFWKDWISWEVRKVNIFKNIALDFAKYNVSIRVRKNKIFNENRYIYGYSSWDLR